MGGELEAGAKSVTHKGDDCGREVALENDGIPGTQHVPGHVCAAPCHSQGSAMALLIVCGDGSANCLLGRSQLETSSSCAASGITRKSPRTPLSDLQGVNTISEKSPR